MSLSVLLASAAERHLIEAMMNPYLADLGGAGPYPHLDRYWHDPWRYPYLLRSLDQIVGFALVQSLNGDTDYELVEFYVAAAFRGQGLGGRAARKLFDTHVGTWSVGVRRDNAAGQRFWASLVKSLPAVSATDVKLPDGVIYKFTSPVG